MHLAERRRNGEALPSQLPESLLQVATEDLPEAAPPAAQLSPRKESQGFYAALASAYVANVEAEEASFWEPRVEELQQRPGVDVVIVSSALPRYQELFDSRDPFERAL